MLFCDVCGISEEKRKINVHSAINMPVSLSYCEKCDEKGYITFEELIRYLAKADKESIIKNLDYIIKNAQVLANKRWVELYG